MSRSMNKPIRVESIKIAVFRKFKDATIDFAKRVTLITGRNGTAKSTLLGILAQPFSFGNAREPDKADESAYISNYHGVRLFENKDISGSPFTYECDQVFRLSEKFDTPDKEYRYETVVSGIDFNTDKSSPLRTKKLITVRQPRAGKLRFVTGPGLDTSISHNAGEGNFPHPVIYLSLGRVLPLAESKRCNIHTGANELTSCENDWYCKAYKEIFSIYDENPTSKLMDATGKKTSIVPNTDCYDGESISAGQDNIGRILTAILSFRRLKVKLGSKYRGGLLLVDEFDATLHAAAQIRLMEVLVKEAKDLDLQIVATTHSLFLVETCLQSALRKETGIVHLQGFSSLIKVESNAKLVDLLADLKNISVLQKKTTGKKRCSVALEDNVAIAFLKALVKKRAGLSTKISFSNIIGNNKPSNISGEYLRIIATNSHKISELNNVVFIPDPDMEWAKQTNIENVIALPGKYSIERQVYRMLKDLSDQDAFWEGCKVTNYSKATSIGNYSTLNEASTPEVKKWFREQKQYWGVGQTLVYDLYYEKNKDECEAFLNKLQVLVERACQ